MAIIYIEKVWPNISSKLNEFINIKNVIDNNIISIEISIKIIFFLFKTKPNTPIKNKINDKFIIKFSSIFNRLILLLKRIENNLHTLKIGKSFIEFMLSCFFILRIKSISGEQVIRTLNLSYY